jgi:hypothetical protein
MQGLTKLEKQASEFPPGSKPGGIFYACARSGALSTLIRPRQFRICEPGPIENL